MHGEMIARELEMHKRSVKIHADYYANVAALEKKLATATADLDRVRSDIFDAEVYSSFKISKDKPSAQQIWEMAALRLGESKFISRIHDIQRELKALEQDMLWSVRHLARAVARRRRSANAFKTLGI